VRAFFLLPTARFPLSQKQITPFTFSEGICILACVPPDVDVEFLVLFQAHRSPWLNFVA
jgi:hypothetical protein